MPGTWALTLITIEEQLSGWYAKIRHAEQPKEMATAYAGFFETYETTKRLRVLPFSAMKASSLTVIQDGGKDARRVEVRQTKPVDGTIHAHQRRRPQVADDPVVLN